MGHAFTGSAGAALSNLITYPLSLIITRLQTQSQLDSCTANAKSKAYISIRDTAAGIYEREGGLGGFYTGLGPDTSKTIADSFLFFLAYTFLRQNRLRTRNAHASRLPVIDELSVGFLAGAFSKFLTTPVANIVTRQQASFRSVGEESLPHSDDQSVKSIFLRIRTEKGLRGLWSGYSASLVLTLNPSLTFFIFEFLKRLLVPRSRRSHLPAQIVFLLAASSKALASTITYPFSLAKSRIQVSMGDESSKASETTSSVQGTNKPDLRRKASNNVFHTVSNIVRQEGAGALYTGLWGEVLKGFFSHGITMSTKDTVHVTILRLYYAIRKFLNQRQISA